MTATEVKQAKAKDKDYKKPDGSGLYLLVKKNGSKYWRLKYRLLKKEKLLAIGVYPAVSLAQARAARDDARKLIAEGIDPNSVKQAEQLAKGDSEANSFKLIASEWFLQKMTDKSKSHKDRTWRALEKDLFPALGSRPITGITPPELLKALRKVESRGAIETAKRATNSRANISLCRGHWSR